MIGTMPSIAVHACLPTRTQMLQTPTINTAPDNHHLYFYPNMPHHHVSVLFRVWHHSGHPPSELSRTVRASRLVFQASVLRYLSILDSYAALWHLDLVFPMSRDLFLLSSSFPNCLEKRFKFVTTDRLISGPNEILTDCGGVWLT